MRQKKHILNLYAQRWLIFASCIILFACIPEDMRMMESATDILSPEKNYNAIDRSAYEKKSNENEKTLPTVQLDNIEINKTKSTQVVLLITHVSHFP